MLVAFGQKAQVVPLLLWPCWTESFLQVLLGCLCLLSAVLPGKRLHHGLLNDCYD